LGLTVRVGAKLEVLELGLGQGLGYRLNQIILPNFLVYVKETRFNFPVK